LNYFNQETERLELRKLTIEDIPSWTPFFVNNDRLKFLGIDIKKDAKTLATEWIENQFKRYENQGLGFLAVVEKKSEKFIGLAGIVPREIDFIIIYEIAYSLLPEFWGNGYATEVATQMKVFGLQNRISTNFVSIIDKNNIESINVAKKNNMIILKEIDNYLGMNVYVFGTQK
jgi:ribosomal-protein-alanine N-acetyltransferase